MTSDELAVLFAMPAPRVAQLLEKGLFRLHHRGRPIAWASDSGRLLFWGEAVDSIYTKENVYWLEAGRGLEMPSSRASRNSTAPITLDRFTDRVQYEQDRFAATLVSSEPESDYWYWTYVSSGHKTFGRSAFTIPVDGLAKVDARVRLAVRLFSATDTSGGTREDHHAKIHVTGVLVGEGRWGGIGGFALEATFGQALLREGDNTIEVEGVLDSGAAFSIFYVDGFELEYQRTFRASDVPFVFRAEMRGEVTVKGLSESEVTVLEITDPSRPRRVKGRVAPDPDGYAVTLAVEAGGTYAVLTSNGIREAVAWRDSPSKLKAPSNAADYVVITPEALLPGAEALSQLRNDRGLDTMVVLLEDVMDEFRDGIWTPHAIREFLSYAHRNWTKPPRFVVLAGSGKL